MLAINWRVSRLTCVAIAAVTVVTAVVPLAIAWINKLIYDHIQAAVSGLGSEHSLWIILGSLVVAEAVAVCLPVVHGLLNGNQNRAVALHVQQVVFRKILSLGDLKYFEDPSFHDSMRLGQQSAQRAAGQVLGHVSGLLRASLTIGGFITLIVASHWILATVLAASVIPQCVAQLRFGNSRASLARILTPSQRRKVFYGNLLTNGYVAKEIILFGLGNYFLSKMMGDLRRIHKSERRQHEYEAAWNTGLGFFASSAAAVGTVYAVVSVIEGGMSLGDLTLFLSALSGSQAALTTIITSAGRLHEGNMFFAHYTSLMRTQPAAEENASYRPVPSLIHGIEFRNVWFRYSNELPWALQGVNLFIPAGSTVALLGLNGAGKSTIVKLATRLYAPDRGQILWDGVNIQEFKASEYRTKIGVVFQDYVKYDMTVRENIMVGDVDRISEMEPAASAAEHAGIHARILQLNRGYETLLSRVFTDEHNGRGSDLSGGEWQRIALARMAVRSADFYILDEPTAAQDALAEMQVLKRISTRAAAKTTLIISHRLSTVSVADAFAVLQNGEIVEAGTHQELMQHDGIYAQIIGAGARGYTDTFSRT